MKHLFSILLVLVVISLNSKAQTVGQIQTRFTNQRALTNTNISTKTGSRSITPQNVGYSDDSIMAISYDLAGLVGSSGDLATVTALGNTTSLSMKVLSSGSGLEAVHDFTGLSINGYPSSSALGLFKYITDGVKLRIYTTSGLYNELKNSSVTANRSALLPDEGDGTDIKSHIVLHETKDIVSVNLSPYGRTDIGYGYIQCKDTSTGKIGKITSYGGTPALSLQDATTSYYSILQSGILGASRTLTTPNASGTIVIRNDTVGGSGAMPSLVTSSYLTNTFGNFATKDLRLTGTRTHHLADYAVTFDSLRSWNMTTTIGHNIFSLNDTTKLSTSLLNASVTNTSKQVRLNAGSANVYVRQDNNTGNSGIIMTARNDGAVSMSIDSVDKAVKLTHISGFTSAPTIAAGAGAGTSPTVSVATGSTDLSGYLNITTGTTCTALATVATITFNIAYASAPKCIIIQPANAATAALTPNAKLVHVPQATISTTTFELLAGATALSDATAYQWYYMVIQ